jgi:predicted RNase H-like HicB family nuclease
LNALFFLDDFRNHTCRAAFVDHQLQGNEPMNLTIETDQEDDGRWIAEVAELPGVLTYGNTRVEAIQLAEALALRVLADRLEHGEPVPEMANEFTVAS